MSKNNLPKWDDERTETLVNMVGDESPVSQSTVTEVSEALETTTRSVASKLRKMDYEVETVAQAHKKTFSPEQEAELKDFLENNEGVYTYAEIALKVLGDADAARKVQGKMLSMDMTGYAKPTPKKEVTKQYSDAEETTFEKMANDGAFLEDIAEALGKELNSVRGKALSMLRSHGITMPKQKESHSKAGPDPMEALEDIVDMTVAEIAETIGKSERGVKVILTNRRLTAKDYDGAARKAKIEAAKEAA